MNKYMHKIISFIPVSIFTLAKFSKIPFTIISLILALEFK